MSLMKPDDGNILIISAAQLNAIPFPEYHSRMMQKHFRLRGSNMDKLDRILNDERRTVVQLVCQNGGVTELRSDSLTDHSLYTNVWRAINERNFENDEIKYIPELRTYQKTYFKRFRYGEEMCDIIVEEPCTSLIAPDHPQAEIVVRVLEKAICR